MGEYKSGINPKGLFKILTGFVTLVLAYSILSSPLFLKFEPINWIWWVLSFGALFSGATVMREGFYERYENKQKKNHKQLDKPKC